jgi:hypothetical protein
MRFFTIVLSVLVLLLLQTASAQVSDNFSDGNFTANPAWTGNTTDWMVNAQQQLQSNNTVSNSAFYLSTANTLATNTQWELYVNLSFNPSSANFVDVFLTSSQSDLSNTAITGYFVRIGNTDDEIALYRKDANGSSIKIIDGVNGILNTSNNILKIKVINTANQWTLFRDITGTGTTYVSEGTVTDATYTTSSFFGFYVRQSTSGFFQRHFFDDIEIKTYVPDVTPPSIQSVTAISPNTLDILFNEPVDLTPSQTTINYSVNNSIGSPISAVRDVTNMSLVRLTFASNFPNGITNTITINGVTDLSGNAINNGTASFSFYIPQRFDVVIDEIFADPTPTIALPNAEFIELKNTSTRAINLQGWRISSLSTTSSPFPSYTLPPDSFLVITSTTNAALFAAYGRVLGVGSFPTLDNTGATLTLTSKEGITIHSVSYNSSWYQNAVKSDGGWTLEMIDTKNPCSGASNWKASVDPRGGTPAAKNSIDANNKDQTSPALLRAAAIDNLTLLLTFDEPLDSLKAATSANYSFSDGIGTPSSALAIAPSFNIVQVRLTTPLVQGKVYTVTASNVADCSGNVVQAKATAKVGLTSLIDSFDVVINEILFNPKPNGVDFVEVYNRSNKIFDLRDMYITNRSSSTGQLGTTRQLSSTNVLFFPGDYYVISENGNIVKQQYTAKTQDNFIDVSSMPSFPDDRGVVVLLNAQGAIIDELAYDTRWHFALIDNEEGVSLERIDYNKPTQKDNFHSAASTAGFGTPGYQNSQFRNDLQVQGDVTVTPKTFSPDNDGIDDFAIINYQVSERGYVANITIYDAAGRPVRVLSKNATLALSGSFRWDGLDDKNRKVPVGTYVIYTEIFNLNGKKKAFKNAVIVAARF